MRKSSWESVSSSLRSAFAAAEYIDANRSALIEVLLRYESVDAALDEVERSIDALRNLHRELPYLRAGRVISMAVYLPINLPLYSIILFGAIPSIMADKVTVRMPTATAGWHRDVAVEAGIDKFFPRMRLVDVTRRSFEEAFVSCSDVVIFTGRFENAAEVRAACPEALFIFEGSGPNPVVLGPDANIAVDFDRYVAPRLFNSGQDCAGPDAYLVHASLAQSFIGKLQKTVSDISPRAAYGDSYARIGPILNRRQLPALRDWLTGLGDAVVSGGKVSISDGTVEPTVVVRGIGEHHGAFELFAPVFNVLVYDCVDDLNEFFDAAEYRENAMYVSVFGQSPVPSMYASSTVLIEQTILEVERGNDAYGGYGPRANYVAKGLKVLAVEPILISSCISRFVDRAVSSGVDL